MNDRPTFDNVMFAVKRAGYVKLPVPRQRLSLSRYDRLFQLAGNRYAVASQAYYDIDGGIVFPVITRSPGSLEGIFDPIADFFKASWNLVTGKGFYADPYETMYTVYDPSKGVTYITGGDQAFIDRMSAQINQYYGPGSAVQVDQSLMSDYQRHVAEWGKDSADTWLKNTMTTNWSAGTANPPVASGANPPVSTGMTAPTGQSVLPSILGTIAYALLPQDQKSMYSYDPATGTYRYNPQSGTAMMDARMVAGGGGVSGGGLSVDLNRFMPYILLIAGAAIVLPALVKTATARSAT